MMLAELLMYYGIVFVFVVEKLAGRGEWRGLSGRANSRQC
jgi:hypothetical protein